MSVPKKNINILFVCPYPFGVAPGQRFRYEMYLDKLSESNISYEIVPFLDDKTNSVLFRDGHVFRKILGVVRGFIFRMLLVFKTINFDFIYIYREATPIGPPFFEWITGKLLGKKIIYDFDDSIFLPVKSRKNKLISAVKLPSKVKSICRWSHLVSCGNSYLADFAKNYNSNVIVMPTIVDTEFGHNKLKRHSGKAKNIGWTGSHSTNYLLNLILPVIEKLQAKHDIQFIVISSTYPEIDGLNVNFVKWSLENEIDELSKIDIGVMPLFDDDWTKGKCGFKAIQYAALGIPSVVSPVGVNSKIVHHSNNGFLADNLCEWEEYLEMLIVNPDLRNEMGEKGRMLIVNDYSKVSTINKFISLFN